MTRSAADGTPRYRRRRVYWVLAVLLAGLATWLSIRQVNWADLQLVLTASNLWLLGGALVVVLLTTIVKAARWQVLLRLCGAHAGFMHILCVLFIGQMANSFLPARLGDVGRAVLIGPRVTGGAPAALGTILTEKALDGVMGVLILISLALWIPLPPWLHAPVWALIALTIGLLGLLAFAAAQNRWAVSFYRRLVGWLPPSVQSKVDSFLKGFMLGLDLFEQPRNALLALALSVLVWMLAAWTNGIVLASLGVQAPRWGIWLVLVTGYVANFMPTVPAQVGVFEYTHMLALVAAGVEQEPALAFSLALHLLVYGPPLILGPLCMLVEGLGWARLKNIRRLYHQGEDTSA